MLRSAVVMPRARKSPRIVWIALVCGVLLSFALAALYFQPLPLDAADRAMLVPAKSLVVTPGGAQEEFSKRRMLNGASKIHYHASHLGTRGQATVTQDILYCSNSASAIAAFAAMKIGGTSAFSLAARSNESMQAREVHYAWADQTYWADYRVGEATAGAFVIVRTGSTVHFISLNGLAPDASLFEGVLRAHWAPQS
jgi:hypothetical protein